MMIIVMGVSGSGKSSVGRALADARGLPFLEGDDLHPAANRAKMAAGRSLDDTDRAPWLDAIVAWMAARPAGVVACSALRQAYRDRLRTGADEARFVLLQPPAEILAERLARRRGHYMPPSLLPSQYATLETPQSGECALVVTADEPVDATVRRIGKWLD